MDELSKLLYGVRFNIDEIVVVNTHYVKRRLVKIKKIKVTPKYTWVYYQVGDAWGDYEEVLPEDVFITATRYEKLKFRLHELLSRLRKKFNVKN